MNLSPQHLLMRTVDGLFACIPRRRPDDDQLAACRVIAHRGEHDHGRSVAENTLEAFRQARAAGVWGIECDIRWTADGVPVISHDDSGERVFGVPGVISGISMAALRERLPQIPTLAELVSEFGGNTHLMLEIKSSPETGREQRQQELARILAEAGLAPGRDYHFLALDPDLFAEVSFVDRQHCLAVSEINAARISREVLERGLGGHTGHFVLIHRAMRARHAAAGQRIGTGFVSSRSTLYREIHRNVDWVFSNHAVRIQGYLEDR